MNHSSPDINEYESLRETALSAGIFCRKNVEDRLWKFSSCGMAKWLQTPSDTAPSALVSFPEMSDTKKCEYPHEVIRVLADMALSNL